MQYSTSTLERDYAWRDEQARELETKYVEEQLLIVQHERARLSTEEARHLPLERALAERLRGNLEFFARKDVLFKTYPPNDDVIICEGDSWFDHPFLQDIPSELGSTFGFSVLHSNKPGKLLSESALEKRFLVPLRDGRRKQIKALLISGGGNDLINWHIGGNGVSAILKAANSNSAADFVAQENLTTALGELISWLNQIAASLKQFSSNIPVLLHCYDHILPRHYGGAPFKGMWLYPQLEKIGAPSELHAEIAGLLQARWMAEYRDAVTRLGWYFVSAENAVKGRWYDEIHPHSIAFQRIAKLFRDQLVSLGVKPSHRGR